MNRATCGCPDPASITGTKQTPFMKLSTNIMLCI